MENPELAQHSIRGDWDWRILLALSLTTIWLGAGVIYIGDQIGWQAFYVQPLESLGSFLEGAFAPLAFLWLVVGYFLQQKELSKNTDAIRRQHEEMRKSSEQAELQAQAIQAYAMHTQQQTFMRIHEAVRESLGGMVGMLYISSQGASGSGAVTGDAIAALWAEMSRGDPEIFSRKFMQLSGGGEENMYDLFFGTEIRSRHTTNFIRQFERLIEAANACDVEGMITDAVIGSAHGLLYNVMLRYRDEPQ
ncbi:MAG: hypothetical protein ACR2P1_17550 [Pseudomonadales bacterium]